MLANCILDYHCYYYYYYYYYYYFYYYFVVGDSVRFNQGLSIFSALTRIFNLVFIMYFLFLLLDLNYFNGLFVAFLYFFFSLILFIIRIIVFSFIHDSCIKLYFRFS